MLTPVILCGGSGTRLWPLSREDYPKQFFPLADGATTLFQDALRRTDGLDPRIPQAAPIVVCNEAHRFIAAQQLQEIGIAGATLLLEPVARNTAPALTLAALATNPESILLALPADHWFARPEGLERAIAAAWPLAQDGAVVTFGVTPDHAETGYGYIRTGAPVAASQALAIEEFTEKPGSVLARDYVDRGGHLWNSGIFMLRASRWLSIVACLQPQMLVACREAMAQRTRDLDFVRPAREAFERAPAGSIDRAVMEHLPRASELGAPAVVMPLDAGWSDLGAWNAIWKTWPHDVRGNASSGAVAAVDTRGCLLFSQGRLLATLGVEDLVVVETPDAVLVARRDRAQDVGQLVADLGSRHDPRIALHRKVHRPWGWYDRIDAGTHFQVKRLIVNPGAALSLQSHHHRAEHWVVVRGTAQVTRGDHTFLLAENESTFIPIGCRHRLANPGEAPLEVIEVQSGDYLGEDDIVRFADAYRRDRTPG